MKASDVSLKAEGWKKSWWWMSLIEIEPLKKKLKETLPVVASKSAIEATTVDLV